jgi:hypothetical protein
VHQRTPCARYIGRYEENARVVRLSAALANARKRDRAGRLARMGPAGICARRIGRPNARGGYRYAARQVPAFNACLTSVIAGRQLRDEHGFRCRALFRLPERARIRAPRSAPDYFHFAR